MGPEVTADQAYRWFDNRRNKKPTKVSSAMNDSRATTSHILKTSRISKHEREMLETAYSQDCAPDMHKRAAIAAAIGISTRQVTNWFARRQASQRPAMPRSLLANVDHGGGDDIGLLSRGLVEGLLPGASTAGVQGGSQMTLPETLAAQGDLGLGIHHPNCTAIYPLPTRPFPRVWSHGCGDGKVVCLTEIIARYLLGIVTI